MTTCPADFLTFISRAPMTDLSEPRHAEKIGLDATVVSPAAKSIRIAGEWAASAP